MKRTPPVGSIFMGVTSNKTKKIEVLIEPTRRRRWSAEEKKVIVDETYQPGISVSIVVRRHGITANQFFTWRRSMENGALKGVGSEDHVILQSELRKALDKIKKFEQLLSRKTEEGEVLIAGIRIGLIKILISRMPLAGVDGFE